MKKLLFLFFALVLLCCASNSWTDEERSTFKDNCIKGYITYATKNDKRANKVGNNYDAKFVLCYCKYLREITENKYSTATQADKAPAEEIYTLSIMAKALADESCIN